MNTKDTPMDYNINTKEYKVSFELTLQETETTEKQVIEWLSYHLGITGELKGTNPLSNIDLSSRDIEINYLRVEKS